MASYSDWNSAIANFFTIGLREGAPVYLTVDEDSLAYIGRHYLAISPESATRNFIAAVKERCTQADGRTRRVNTRGATGNSDDGIPECACFLSAMVLAAHQMESDQGQHIDGTNYFRRFTELLALTPGAQSRPLGFATGEEERLWKTWNAWIALNSLKPTAKGGEGAHAYIDYPIEQALLRKDDRRYLETKFRIAFKTQQEWMLDEAQLASWLMRQPFTRRHLQAGFNSRDPDRASAFVDAAFRIYQAMNWDAPGGDHTGQGNDKIKLTGGIIRKVSIRGAVQYQLLARKPSRWKSSALAVVEDGTSHPLAPFRTDLFAPLWTVPPFPEAPMEYQVDGDPLVESLIFPKRDYWILTNDPDDPLGQLGTWEKYPNLLGRKFWILIRGSADGLLPAELAKYRDEKLIDWEKCETNSNGWLEYRGCMILSRSWDCIVPSSGSESLFDALQPAMFASIGLSGGIRVPDGQGWIEGFPPTLTVYGFESDFTVEVAPDNGREPSHIQVQQQVPRCLLECVAPGTYQLTASWRGRPVASKAVRIAPWESLHASTTPPAFYGSVCGMSLCGAELRLPDANALVEEGSP